MIRPETVSAAAIRMPIYDQWEEFVDEYGEPCHRPIGEPSRWLRRLAVQAHTTSDDINLAMLTTDFVMTEDEFERIQAKGRERALDDWDMRMAQMCFRVEEWCRETGIEYHPEFPKKLRIKLAIEMMMHGWMPR